MPPPISRGSFIPPAKPADVRDLLRYVDELARRMRDYVQRDNENLSAIQSRLEILEADSERHRGVALFDENIHLPPVEQFAVAGRQGLFHLTWAKALGRVDGYTVLMASDSAMANIIGRWEIRNRETCQFQIPIGNCTPTRYFQISKFTGKVSSPPSAIVSATAVAFGSGEADPPDPPTPPDPPGDSPPGGELPEQELTAE